MANKTKTFDIYDNEDEYVDTVFFDATMDEDEVKRSLVNHDGYSPTIVVIER